MSRQGELFDNERTTQRAKPPAWVVRELIERWGCDPKKVAKWHLRQAYAVMHSFRERKDPKAQRSKRIGELVNRLNQLLVSDSSSTEEIHDVVNEALSELDLTALGAVCETVTALLTPLVEGV